MYIWTFLQFKVEILNKGILKSMRFTFSKEIYSKKTLLRASYAFTDEFYVHLSADEREYIVELSAKTGDNSIEYEEFNNEILSQALKEQLETDTKDIRTLIMARALSSSLIDNSEGTAEIENNDESTDSIMKDWFEQNEWAFSVGGGISFKCSKDGC